MDYFDKVKIVEAYKIGDLEKYLNEELIKIHTNIGKDLIKNISYSIYGDSNGNDCYSALIHYRYPLINKS